jgi:tetratricopeptide (TPR) repeat protein
MPLSENDINLIEDHLDENLSTEGATLFQSKMKDSSFIDEVVFRKKIVEGIHHYNSQQLKEELKQQLITRGDLKRDIGFGYIRYWPVAAAVAALIVALLWVLVPSGNQNRADDIYIAYYKPFSIATTTRGNNLSESPAFDAYNSQDYQMAAALFEKLLAETNPESTNITLFHLLAGNCYLNTNHLEKAISNFTIAMSSSDKILSQHGQWYYSLALIKQGNVKMANEELSAIINDGSIYAKQAVSILNKLKEIN